jgi:hypothetical protein
MKRCTNLKSISIYKSRGIKLQDLPTTLTEISLIYTNKNLLNLKRFKSLRTLKILRHTCPTEEVKDLSLPPHLETL